MDQNFDKALSFVLQYEGGYSDHPEDPGGATNHGITQNVLAVWRGHRITKNDVRDLGRVEAGEIYKARYWKPCRCSILPAGIDFAVFDCAVNQGIGRATHFLQRSVKVTVDGVIGPVTLSAIRREDPEILLKELCALRMQSYGRLTRLFKTFGLGWSRRLTACLIESLKMTQPKEHDDGCE